MPQRRRPPPPTFENYKTPNVEFNLVSRFPFLVRIPEALAAHAGTGPVETFYFCFAFSGGARNRPDPLDADHSLLTEFQVLATADSLYATRFSCLTIHLTTGLIELTGLIGN